MKFRVIDRCAHAYAYQEQPYWTISRAIKRMVEQNHDQKYSYDRETLIEMLDAAMAKQSGEVLQ